MLMMNIIFLQVLETPVFVRHLYLWRRICMLAVNVVDAYEMGVCSGYVYDVL